MTAGAQATGGALAAIHRHPVKSLGVEALERVTLAPGAWMPMDRVWAVTRAGTAFDADNPDWVEPNNFARVTHAPRLAQARAGWDGATLTLAHPDAPALSADPETAEGRAAVEAWVAPLVEDALSGPFHLARARQPLTDVDRPWLSLHSLASLRALSEAAGRPLDPLRFRGNLWIEGLEPWAEAQWPGRVLAVGAVRLRVVEPIWRCAATQANPDTGARDADTLGAMRRLVGDTCFGVYAEVVEGGEIALGDAVRPV